VFSPLLVEGNQSSMVALCAGDFLLIEGDNGVSPAHSHLFAMLEFGRRLEALICDSYLCREERLSEEILIYSLHYHLITFLLPDLAVSMILVVLACSAFSLPCSVGFEVDSDQQVIHALDWHAVPHSVGRSLLAWSAFRLTQR